MKKEQDLVWKTVSQGILFLIFKIIRSVLF